MRNRNVSILSVTVLVAAVLFNFQNCAPAPTVATQGNPFDPEVRIIDDWNKAEIQFVQESVQVHDEADAAGVSGLCSRVHNGERIRWALWGDDGNRPVLGGEIACRSGQFAVEIENLDNVVCGIPYRLVVEGDWGAMASAQFEKRCQPLASEHVEAPAASPAGTDCSLEYVPAQSANSCAQVCYREAKVVLNVTVDPARCSGLIQKLASP